MTDIIAFVHDTHWRDFSQDIKKSAILSLTDTIGVAAAGSQTQLSKIIRDHAARHFGGDEATIWWDGRRVSPAGAALANAMTIDALDAHDGQKFTKGHIGCGLIPALVAFAESEDKQDAEEFLSCLVIGYEFGTRAGVSLHASVPDYHTSGAWIAVTAAALGARYLGLDRTQTREAMGIAEYHGPRSQMMRCIDHPTMVKDGSGWGAMAGVSAAYLAAEGFTGAPAVTVEGEEVAEHWADLGQHWYMTDQYMKLYPVCRWAQPAAEAALAVMRDHKISADDIDRITIDSFHEAVRLGTMASNTEQAQYSLPFSVAALVTRGTIGIAEVTEDGLADQAIQEMARKITITENDEFNAVFPKQRFARAAIQTKTGEKFQSDTTRAQGDPENKLTEEQLADKFNAMVTPRLGSATEATLKAALSALGQGGPLSSVLEILRRAPTSAV